MTKRKTAILILAAGKGTRMKSDLEKVLHPLAGMEMIGHVLSTALALAPDRLVAVIGKDMASVETALAPVPTVVQDPPLGTGHGVMAARDHLAGFDGDVLVVFGDTPLLLPQTLTAMLEALADPSSPVVVVLGMRPDDAGQYGRLVTGSQGELLAIVEYADADAKTRRIALCNSGVMAFRGEHLFDLLDSIGNDNAKGEYYLTDVIAKAREKGLSCCVVEADEKELLGVNSRADLAWAEKVLQDRLRAQAMEGGVTMTDPASVFLAFDTQFGRDVTLGPNICFGRGVKIGDGVEIRAFSHIERAEIKADAVIGPFARLRPGAEIGIGAHVGNFVEIKNAVLEKGAKVNHLSYIGDASVGAGANIGAGTITCNYDGLKKSHTEIAAGAFIGSNTSLVAPVSIGARAVIGAGSVITEDVSDDDLVLTRAKPTKKTGGAKRYRDKSKKVS